MKKANILCQNTWSYSKITLPLSIHQLKITVIHQCNHFLMWTVAIWSFGYTEFSSILSTCDWAQYHSLSFIVHEIRVVWVSVSHSFLNTTTILKDSQFPFNRLRSFFSVTYTETTLKSVAISLCLDKLQFGCLWMIGFLTNWRQLPDNYDCFQSQINSCGYM